MTYKLGIIGTAGRGDDRWKLNSDQFKRMCRVSADYCQSLHVTHGVSGGAAYADHVIVKLGLSKRISPKNITLFLPAEIDYEQRQYVDSGFKSPGSTANYYMKLFYMATGVNGVSDIIELERLGATLIVNNKGFKARNSDVANFLQPENQAAVIAWTFGSDHPGQVTEYDNTTTAIAAGLKDGGTADTWNKCNCKKLHGCLK